MPLSHGNLSLTNFDLLDLFSKTFYELNVRDLAYMCTLKQRCSKFYRLQNLFLGHLMKICGACSKVAHKAEFSAVFNT